MLLCISGSLRRGSTNTCLLTEAARHFGGPVRMADLRLPLYDADLQTEQGIPDAVQDLARAVSEASAIAVSTPEYNQSLSGVLKNALDWISRTEGSPWEDKPVAVMAAANGRSGGARAAYALRWALTPFRPRFSAGPEMLLPAAKEAFDASGRLVDSRAEATLVRAMERLRAEAEAAALTAGGRSSSR